MSSLDIFMQKRLLSFVLAGLLVWEVAGAQEKKKNSYSIDYSLINTLSENASASIDMLFIKDTNELKWMHGFSMRKDKGIGYSIGVGTNKPNTNLDFLLSAHGNIENLDENSNKENVQLGLTGRARVKSKLFKGDNLNAGVGYGKNIEYSIGLGIDVKF